MMQGIKIRNSVLLEIHPLKGKPVLEILRDGCDILDSLELDYWVSAGTALGLRREKQGFIDHDTDLDVEVFVHDKYNFNVINSAFQKDYDTVRIMEVNNRVSQIAFLHKKTKIIFDVYFYYDLDELCLVNENDHGTLLMPKDYLENKSEVRGFKCPNPIESYLEYRYGKDWMIPKKKKVSWENDAGKALKK